MWSSASPPELVAAGRRPWPPSCGAGSSKAPQRFRSASTIPVGGWTEIRPFAGTAPRRPRGIASAPARPAPAAPPGTGGSSRGTPDRPIPRPPTIASTGRASGPLSAANATPAPSAQHVPPPLGGALQAGQIPSSALMRLTGSFDEAARLVEQAAECCGPIPEMPAPPAFPRSCDPAESPPPG